MLWNSSRLPKEQLMKEQRLSARLPSSNERLRMEK